MMDEYEIGGEDFVDPVCKRIHYTSHIKNTMKARLFEDDIGWFWVPMAMIFDYTNTYIDVYKDFNMTYNSRKAKVMQPFDEIEGDFE